MWGGNIERYAVIEEIKKHKGEKYEEVILPEGLEEIEEECFKDCINLRKINIPKGCKVGKGAFGICIKLHMEY